VMGWTKVVTVDILSAPALFVYLVV